MSKKIPSYAKAYKNHSVLIFDENDSMTQYPVYTIDGDCIEYEDGILHQSDALKCYDNNNGGFTYIFNLDKPALVEANNLKNLRRDVSIKNMMNFETDKGTDLAKLMPYLLVVIALIFS
ncbi:MULTISPECIES: hypothetical protein [unclassified Exiguobacterium]|uniref:hypothetical protein n=1 Tax=unclassified Exiguobacterium TaxID=2644629 RepID=UPI001BEB7FCC|nr:MULTISPECIES: hypothetical protein [unclassified Exiguobacterium]